MRALVTASAAAAISGGCSFTPGVLPPASDDAPPAMLDDADVDAVPDAPPDAPRTWQIVETIVVNTAEDDPEVSTTVLANGVVYRLRVSGTINTVIDNHQGDADWFDFNAPKDLGCCEDIGLGIDDLVVNDKVTLPDWGPYNPTHVYEVEWVGEGRTITALFQDTYYGNNQGNLTLQILELR